MHNGERATFQEVNIPTIPSNQEPINGEANEDKDDVLVVFINTFRGYFELVIHSEYILVAAILRVLWLTKIFHKVWGRDDFSQTPRVSKDACSGKFDQLSCRLDIKGDAYLIVANSFLPGHQVPAAIRVLFPGWTRAACLEN